MKEEYVSRKPRKSHEVRSGFQTRGRVIFFVTNNFNKFNEARKILAEYKIAIGMLRIKGLEIQNESLEEIARKSVLEAYKKCRLPVIVEDAGLFIDALNGFPGPYAAYVYKTIGNRGLLKLMKNMENREARFQSIIAYHYGDLKSPVCFEGKVVGEIIEEERKLKHEYGFGFDPIFKPGNNDRTFAEMNLIDKNSQSHRAKAVRKFARWYRKLLQENQ